MTSKGRSKEGQIMNVKGWLAFRAILDTVSLHLGPTLRVHYSGAGAAPSAFNSFSMKPGVDARVGRCGSVNAWFH